MPLSPIELLLPRGFAERSIVLGSACPSVLVPPSSESTPEEASVDLVVLAPSRDERRDATWIETAASAAAARLTPDGIAYVVPANTPRLRRALAAHGLRPTRTLLHIPDVSRSRHIVPTGTRAAQYALSGRLGMKRLKRLAAAGASHSTWAATLGPTGAVLRPDPAIPLSGWLFALAGAPAPAGSVLITTRGAGSPGNVLHRFAEGEREPDAVVKVAAEMRAERRALLEIAPTAARSGARVPEVLWSGTLGRAEALAMSHLSGREAARLVARGRLDIADLQERVAAWLEHWGRSTACHRPLDHDDLDRLVMSPARGLTAGNGPYLDYLGELCTRAAGSTCPFVAAHGDLTAANIAVDGPGSLGILDWEEASHAGLPLVDFFYAAADTVAAARGYNDRPGSVIACFAADGERAPFVQRLVSRLAGALDVGAIVTEVCFHACWLHHASSEAHRQPSASSARPFGAILRTVAADPDRFATPLYRSR